MLPLCFHAWHQCAMKVHQSWLEAICEKSVGLWSHVVVGCSEWRLALSCWKNHGPLGKRCLLDGCISLSKVTTYASAPMILSHICKSSMPWALMQPYTVLSQALDFTSFADNRINGFSHPLHVKRAGLIYNPPWVMQFHGYSWVHVALLIMVELRLLVHCCLRAQRPWQTVRHYELRFPKTSWNVSQWSALLMLTNQNSCAILHWEIFSSLVNDSLKEDGSKS